MNKDGLLDVYEIASMFHCLRIPINPGALHAIVRYFDEDGDDKLSFREVKRLSMRWLDGVPRVPRRGKISYVTGNGWA